MAWWRDQRQETEKIRGREAKWRGEKRRGEKRRRERGVRLTGKGEEEERAWEVEGVRDYRREERSVVNRDEVSSCVKGLDLLSDQSQSVCQWWWWAGSPLWCHEGRCYPIFVFFPSPPFFLFLLLSSFSTFPLSLLLLFFPFTCLSTSPPPLSSSFPPLPQNLSSSSSASPSNPLFLIPCSLYLLSLLFLLHFFYLLFFFLPLSFLFLTTPPPLPFPHLPVLNLLLRLLFFFSSSSWFSTIS